MPNLPDKLIILFHLLTLGLFWQ